jgi:hypothetical protein
MTSSKDAATAGRRRGRLLATAGIGVAAVVGSLMATAPANAADAQPTNPSVTLDLPDNIANDNTPADVDVTIDNTQTGNGDLSNLRFQAELTLPSGIKCSTTNPTITGKSGTVTKDGNSQTVTSPPLTYDPSASTDQNCVYYAQGADALAANQKDQLTYSLSVDGRHGTEPSTTGTLNGKFLIIQQNSDHNYKSTLASDTDSSELSNPSAPSFNDAPTNAAALYSSYSYDLVDSEGFPEASASDENTSVDCANEGPAPEAEADETPTDEGYYAFGAHKNGEGDYDTTGRLCTEQVKNAAGDTIYVIHLVSGNEDGNASGQFYFDASNGEIESATVKNGTYSVDETDAIDAAPYWTWTIIANNGKGGGNGNAATNNPSETGKPDLNDHDVTSGQFTLPVLFGDVSQSSSFAGEIYALANADVIKGYGDGNFKSGNSITRRAFVTFEARVYNALPNNIKNGKNNFATGACKKNQTSGFSDVSNNSQFCEQIRQLTRVGVINGYDDGTFQPGNHVTRRAIAAFLFRLDSYLKGAAVGDAECTTPTGYNDVNENTAFCGDIEWLTDHDIASGYDDGGFHPGGDTTRRAGAAFFFRFGNYEHAGTFTSPFSNS